MYWIYLVWFIQCRNNKLAGINFVPKTYVIAELCFCVVCCEGYNKCHVVIVYGKMAAIFRDGHRHICNTPYAYAYIYLCTHSREINPHRSCELNCTELNCQSMNIMQTTSLINILKS